MLSKENGEIRLTNYVILAHGDSDGLTSASIAYAFLRSKGYSPRVVFTHPAGLLEDINVFTKEGEHVIIVDIAISELHSEMLMKRLEEISKKSSVVYIDHHPLTHELEISGGLTWIHDTCCSASELTYRFFEKQGLDPDYSRIALYGAIGDYLDETEWVRKELDRWDKRSVYLEAGILIQGLEGSRKDYDFKRLVVEHLSENKLPSTLDQLSTRALKQSIIDEQLRIWVKHNLVKYSKKISYVLNPPGSVGRAANYARIYGESPVGIAIEERKEIYVMSLRAMRGVDLNKILRELSRQLGINGGGHPQAAGARMRKEVFDDFLEKLDKMIPV